MRTTFQAEGIEWARKMTQRRHTTSNTVFPEHGISEVKNDEMMGKKKIWLGTY